MLLYEEVCRAGIVASVARKRVYPRAWKHDRAWLLLLAYVRVNAYVDLCYLLPVTAPSSWTTSHRPDPTW